MSEQTGGKHGPAEDEAIKRQGRADLQEQGEEWPGPASPDDPQEVWAEEGRFAGTPPDEDWQASNCAATWPVSCIALTTPSPGHVCSRS